MSSIRISRLANQLNSISSHLSALQSRPSSRIATSNLDCFSLSPYRHQPFIQHRSFTLTRLKLKEPPSDGIKSTYPSSDEPERGNAHTDAQAHNPRGDRGHLSFTKASLFKLTLPLHSDSSNSTPSSPLQIQSTPTAERAHSVVFLLHGGQPLSYIASLIRAEAPSPEPGARQTQSNENYPTSTSSDSSIASTDSEGGFSESNESTFVDSSEPSAQSAPSPESPPAPAPTPKYEPNSVSKKEINQGAKQTWENQAYADETKDREDEERDFKRSSSPALGTPPITFHTKSGDGKRWSPSTGIGDFLRDAARAGSFVISVGNRAVLVSVPSFEDRTRFLRSSLYAKTSQIETLAKLKGECDSIAHKSSRRLAFAGLGILGTWWITCCYLTFFTELGWDTLEPVSYLVGLGTLGAGYTWFLAHNRDISYRAVLSESTSRRQQQLYIDRGFNVELYMDLIDEVKDLRKTIKKIATEYGDQQWDQGDTRSGQENKRALEIIRNREAQESGPTSSSKDEDEEEGEEGSDGEKKKSSNPSKRKGGEDDSTGKGSKEMELDQRDNDGDGIPDGKQKKQRGGK